MKRLCQNIFKTKKPDSRGALKIVDFYNAINFYYFSFFQNSFKQTKFHELIFPSAWIDIILFQFLFCAVKINR